MRPQSPGRTLNVAVIQSIDGGYLAYVKELPGCVAQGETEEEAQENVVDVAIAFIEAMLEEAGTRTPNVGEIVEGKIVRERAYTVKPPELVPA